MGSARARISKTAFWFAIKSLTEKLFRRIQKFRTQPIVVDLCTTILGIDNNVELPGNFPKRSSKDLPKHALDAISNDGASDFPRYRNSQSRMPNLVRPKKQNETLRMDLPAGFIKRSVVRGFNNSDRTWKLFRVRFSHSPSAFFVLWHAFA